MEPGLDEKRLHRAHRNLVSGITILPHHVIQCDPSAWRRSSPVPGRVSFYGEYMITIESTPRHDIPRSNSDRVANFARVFSVPLSSSYLPGNRDHAMTPVKQLRQLHITIVHKVMNSGSNTILFYIYIYVLHAYDSAR